MSQTMTPPDPPVDVRGHLLPLSGLLAHKAAGKGGPLGLVGRVTRKVVKVLIRPWLDFQTRFNHGVIEQAVQLHDVQRHQNALGLTRQAEAEAVIGSLRAGLAASDARADELQVACDRLTRTLEELSARHQAEVAELRQELAAAVGRMDSQLAEANRTAEERAAEVNRAAAERAAEIERGCQELRRTTDKLSSAVVTGAGQHALLKDVFRQSLAGLTEWDTADRPADALGAITKAADDRLEAGRVEWIGLGVPGPYRLTSQPCTFEQMNRPEFRRWADELRHGFFAHRKVWEWCYIVEAFHERGLLRPGCRGLGFAVGTEPLSALFASYGCEVVATDLGVDDPQASHWGTNNEHAAGRDQLNLRGICPPHLFDKRVRFRPVDMNAIPRDLTGFDFCWSSCSLEHLGSLEHGMRFLENMTACLKPGGVGVHTTELNVYSDDATVETGNSVIYRRRDIERMAERLKALGCELVARNYFCGDTPTDLHVDEPPYSQSPHLKMSQGGFVATSTGLIVLKE